MITLQEANQSTVASPRLCPLVVDLDGTLIRSDMLIETFFDALGASPIAAISALGGLAHGRATLKDRLAQIAAFDPASLPYDEAILDLIRRAREDGREVYLASASNERLVRAVAEHLGLFTGWMASDATTNLSGERKAALLVERIGSGNFDYIGNDSVDLAVWRHASQAISVRASGRTRAALERFHPAAIHLGGAGPSLRLWLKLLRVHQYAKNALLFVPLVTAHAFYADSLIRAVLGFVAFSLCASGVYLLNDLVDIRADRAHPTKHVRPLASGTIPAIRAVAVIPVLFLAALGLALAVSPAFLGVIGVYCGLTTAYSFVLKRKMLIDVVALASLYSIRVFAGAVAIDVHVSEWLLGFSMFMFMSLALIKRYIELSVRLDLGLADPSNRNYKLGDLQIVALMGGSSGFNAVTVLALYLASPDVHLLYRSPVLLWLLCPLIMYWIARMLMMAHRRHVPEDPILFAIRDRVSLVTLALCLVIIVAASV